jgi:hypothetical protein
MRIAVAGSSGLIGTALVAHLRASAHEVVRLVRRPEAGPDERRWDPRSGDVPRLNDVDAVVNLCGAGIGDHRWNAARKQVLKDSRTMPTEVLAKAVTQQHIPTLINASAVGYYGDTGDRTVTERSGNGDDFLAGLCRAWEAATEPAVDARVVHLRSGLVLSRDGGLLAKIRPVFSLLLGGKLGDGRQFMPWISLDDEVSAIRFVLERNEISGPVNVTGPLPVRNVEFTRTLARALRRPAPWKVPAFALKAVLGEFADVAVLAGQRAVPEVLTEAGFDYAHPRFADAVRAALR